MTEQQPRRPHLAAILTLLAALAVSGGVIATLGILSDHGEPIPAAAPVEAAAPSNLGPSATPNTDTDTTPPAVGPPVTVPPRTASPNAANAAKAAGWLADMPRKPVFAGTAGPVAGPTYEEGVVPGTPCPRPGALGHTREGKPMSCAPAAKDARPRWREVAPPR